MTPGLSRARPLDGLTDFAVLARGDGAVKLVLNDKSGMFVELMPVSVGMGTTDMAAADLDRDGDLDVVSANGISKNLSILKNDGTGLLAPYVPVPLPADSATLADSVDQLALGDLDKDGFPDLVAVISSKNLVSIFYNDRTGFFQNGYYLTTGVAPVGVVIADIDRNGFQDLIVANRDSYTVTIGLRGCT